MEWISVKDDLPNVSDLGDGNVCWVLVKDSDGEFKCLFGSSGAPNEPNSFFTDRQVTHWRKPPLRG